jgi:hypothetical protein
MTEPGPQQARLAEFARCVVAGDGFGERDVVGADDADGVDRGLEPEDLAADLETRLKLSQAGQLSH